MPSLLFDDGIYSAFRQNLLAASPREQAGFAYFADSGEPDLPIARVEILSDEDFVVQQSDYIEISDEARQRIIVTAHEGGFGVVEFHTHPFPLPAEFSYADFSGLQNAVPHMLWRLKRRAYGAIVIGPSDFDGLLWLPDQSVHQVNAIFEGPIEFAATRRSIERWQSLR